MGDKRTKMFANSEERRLYAKAEHVHWKDYEGITWWDGKHYGNVEVYMDEEALSGAPPRYYVWASSLWHGNKEEGPAWMPDYSKAVILT